MPDELLNEAIIIACLEKDVNLDYLNTLDPEKATPKIIMAIKKIVDELEYIPEHWRTPEICLSYVQKNWRNIEIVPSGTNYKAVYLKAVPRPK